MRSCDGCTVCCYVAEIPELRKPANSLCALCVPKVGCEIYESRPGSCQKFKCAWLAGEISDERLRPDRCGVMFERVGKFLVAFTGRSSGQRWQQPAVQEEIKRHLVAGTPVMVREGESRWHALVPEGMRGEDAIEGFRKEIEDRAWLQPPTAQT